MFSQVSDSSDECCTTVGFFAWIATAVCRSYGSAVKIIDLYNEIVDSIAEGIKSQSSVQRPFVRGCSRYCEWGPFKGHTSYHQT